MKILHPALYNAMAMMFIIISWLVIYSISLHWDMWSDLGYMSFKQFASLFSMAVMLNSFGWAALVLHRR